MHQSKPVPHTYSTASSTVLCQISPCLLLHRFFGPSRSSGRWNKCRWARVMEELDLGATVSYGTLSSWTLTPIIDFQMGNLALVFGQAHLWQAVIPPPVYGYSPLFFGCSDYGFYRQQNTVVMTSRILSWRILLLSRLLFFATISRVLTVPGLLPFFVPARDKTEGKNTVAIIKRCILFHF